MNAERRMRRGRKSNFARQDVSEIKSKRDKERERGRYRSQGKKRKAARRKEEKKTGALIAAHKGRDPSGYADT